MPSRTLPRHALAEALHLAAGLALTLLVFTAGAWAYPVGRYTTRLVGWGTMAAVLLMGLPALLRAWRADRDAA